MPPAAPSRHFRDYLPNGFWLVLPALLIDLWLTGDLPARFQPDIFWRDIPAAVTLAENVLRTLVLAVPLLLHIGLKTATQRLGLGLYLVGLAAYALSWLMHLRFADSGWSLGVAGFLAPAYTPLLWLAGIGLMADRSFVPALPYRPWMFVALSLAFVAAHTAHASIVFGRPA